MPIVTKGRISFRWLQGTGSWCVVCDCETARGYLPLCEPCEQRSAVTPYSARAYRAGLLASPFIYVHPALEWWLC